MNSLAFPVRYHSETEVTAWYVQASQSHTDHCLGSEVAQPFFTDVVLDTRSVLILLRVCDIRRGERALVAQSAAAHRVNYLSHIVKLFSLSSIF